MSAIITATHRDTGRFTGLKVGIICAGSPIAGNGGAERFYAGLRRGFERIGCKPEFVEVDATEPSVDQILRNYDLAADMDLSGFDMVVSSKVPTYAVRHPNHVMYLNHAVRIFDDMFDYRFPDATAGDYADRARIHAADNEALAHVKACMSQGFEISRRLHRWRGRSAEVLHPPLGFSDFHIGDGPGEFFLLAGRLHPWKRFDLLIKAMKHSSRAMSLVIVGEGEHGDHLRALAGDDTRIKFLGRVSDDELVDLYSRALAIPFVPQREDYGYVTLEAFASGCPVLTCTDSGEPAHIVRNYETGLVVNPTPADLCSALEWFWDNREEARQMGLRGFQQVSQMSWADTAYALATAAMDGIPDPAAAPLKVAVLDMQPIDPPTGGGRLRLLGLYHGLGERVEANYVGTYDWPGEKFRAHALTPTLFETDIPLTDEHHGASAELAQRAGGKNVIDLAFSRQAYLSPDYIAAARKATENAHVVVFSHPWIYPLVKNQLRPNQVVIYESHNVEGFLRAQLLSDSNPVERDVLEGVIQDELECGRRADWILACSHEDLLRFNRLYGFSPEKMRVVPNGVMAFNSPAPDVSTREAARQELGISHGAFCGIFIGSAYGPNVDAAHFINEALSKARPETTFIIAGGVGAQMQAAGANVIITGPLDDAARDKWYAAADFAVNPMMAGSGTNIKMFDFMAAGLPIISTEVGARGIEPGAFMRVVAAHEEAFAAAIADLRADTAERAVMGKAARACVEESYSWERISDLLGRFMASREAMAGQSRPKFSVVIPSYERHGKLGELMHALSRQIERDFEVIIVDQSQESWSSADHKWGFPQTYYHSPVKGAVRARNNGAMLAQGEIIAFIDDDCLPEADWLTNARKYFDDAEVVGLEGLIRSDHEGDPDWRPVTNVGFEGIGFMTANLMVRSSAFQYLGGFDLQFDKPHFREDTDFGWRLQDLGKVPYGRDVVVFHPAQPRSLERESLAERTKFFCKDALLWKKHPERYRELFIAEGHFLYTPGFKDALLTGFHSLGMTAKDLPDWMTERLLESSVEIAA